MPRKPTDHVQEQRFSLSNHERKLAQEYMIAYKNKSYINGVTQAVGGISLGAGVLLAGWAYMKFKAPDIKEDVKNFVFSSLDSVADVILPNQPMELRRMAQDLAAERARISSKIAVVCNYSSENFDEAECTTAHAEKDEYYRALLAFQEHMKIQYSQMNRNYRAGFWSWVFGGLGDIDPNMDSNPNNDFDTGTLPTR